MIKMIHSIKSARGWGIDVIGIQSDDNPLSKLVFKC